MAKKCVLGCVFPSLGRVHATYDELCITDAMPTLPYLHDGVVVGLHGALDGGEEGGVDEDGGERRPRRTHQGLQHVCKRERDWVRKEYPLVRYKSC